MLKFKKIELKDLEILKEFAISSGRFSCESNFVNLFVWQSAYDNMYAVCDGMMFVKSGNGEDESFRLPFGDDLEKGLSLLREYTGNPTPPFWVQEGECFYEFYSKYKNQYQLIPERDAFDYIYLQSNLANLSGKKYHSKRNHISSFSKQYDWEYKEITKQNFADVLECADEWYALNAERADKYMECEKQGIKTILQNFELLNIKGGAIYIDGKVVAFALGSPINSEIFDIHIEKALPQYATAYAVINNEFAKTLGDYKFINREDDMGLEGLRKAKLSYKPDILLKKYFCVPKKDILRKIYHDNFGEEDNTFEKKLFETNFQNCFYLEKDGEIVSMCFGLPCRLKDKKALYIFAVATDEKHRNKGYAKELLKEIKDKTDAVLILRPVNESLIEFYKKSGFKTFTATNNQNDFELQIGFLALAKDYKETIGNYTAMYYYPENLELDGLYFPYSMP